MGLSALAICGFAVTLSFTPDDRPMREARASERPAPDEVLPTRISIRPSTAFFQRQSSIEHSADGCGLETAVTLENPEILGTRYADGDELVALVRYSAPSCLQAGARFYGYHQSGSPWYDHWCHDDCAERFGSSFFDNGMTTLPAGEGLVAIPAVPGRHPPANASMSPSLEGFTLCSIEVNFSDGRFGGTYYTRVFGYRC